MWFVFLKYNIALASMVQDGSKYVCSCRQQKGGAEEGQEAHTYCHLRKIPRR